MNVGTLVRRLLGRSPDRSAGHGRGETVAEVDRDRVAALADDAADDDITTSLLAGEENYTHGPPAAYLEDGEQPIHVLFGGRVWFGENPSVRADETPSMRTIVLFTDERILIVVGKRFSDSVWGVPFEGVEFVNVKYGDGDAYLLIEAEYRDEPQEFFVELLGPVDADRYREITRYCNDR